MYLTKHAAIRLQQRSIPSFVLECLEAFGSSMRCGGADRLFFDKAARRRLRLHLGDRRRLQDVERWLKVYVVIGDDGKVITAARRTKRFRRKL